MSVGAPPATATWLSVFPVGEGEAEQCPRNPGSVQLVGRWLWAPGRAPLLKGSSKAEQLSGPAQALVPGHLHSSPSSTALQLHDLGEVTSLSNTCLICTVG